jgi:hypothetical protein
MAIKVRCQNCGKEFETSPCQIKNGKAKYCSFKCKGEAQSTIQKKEDIELTCEWCGAGYNARPHEKKKRKYCSVSCASRARQAGSRPRPYYDKGWLYQKYIVEDMSINKIAKLCGVGYETIRGFLIKLDIERRSPGNPYEIGNRFKDGRNLHTGGYIRVWNRDIGDYVFEHRLIAEAVLGRPLTEDEIVHHINGDPADNRPENLMVLESQSEHARLHVEERRGAQCR